MTTKPKDPLQGMLRKAALCVEQMIERKGISPGTKIMWNDNPKCYDTLGNFKVELKRMAKEVKSESASDNNNNS